MPIKATYTGDVSDLKRASEQAGAEFRKVSKEAEKTARTLKDVGSKFDGTAIEGAAQRVARSVARIGDASKLTDSELQRAKRSIDEYIQKAARMGTEVPTHIQKLSEQMRLLDLQQKAAAQSAQQLSQAGSGIGASLKSGLGALAGGLGIGLGAGAGLAAITAVGGALRDMAEQGTKLGPLSSAFEKLQGGAGNAKRTLEEMRSSTKGLVSELDLMRQANQASQLNLTALGVKMSDLAGVAVRLGSAVGNDATQSIDDLIGALGRGSTEVLDNLGITLKLSEAYEIYATRIGKTVAQLTDQEKKQAFVTIAMERAKEAADKLGEQQLTVMQQAGRIATLIGDIGAAAFSSGNQTLTLADALGKVAGVLERLKNAAPSGIAAISREPDLALGVAIQTLPQGTGPLGALVQEYLRLRMGGLDPVDIARLNAAARTGDIQLPGAPRTGAGGGTPGPPPDQLAALKKWNEEIAELTGEKTLAAGRRLARQLEAIAKAGKRIASDNVEDLAQRLMEAREVADETSAPYRELGRALERLPMQANQAAITMGALPTAAIGMNQGVLVPNRLAITTTGLTPAVEPTRIYRVQQALISGDRATQDWADSVRDLAQAMSQFSQITGNALDPVSQWVGRMAAGLDTGRALARTLGLGGTTGGLTAIGLGAGSVGWQLGMQGGMSPGRAAAAGALSGAGQGAYYGGAGFAIGAIVGATSAYFGAQKAEEEVRRAKDLQAQTLVAQYGTLDALLATVSSLGLNTQTFLERYYGDPQEFAKAVTDLNNALTAQRREAEALGKSLQEVQRVQGVLSRDQLAQMQRQLRSGGEGAAAVVEFAAQQRQQAEQGLTQAVAALAALEEQSATTLTQFEGAAQAAAAGLVVAFTEAIQQGESAISVLQRLGPSIQSLQAMFGRAGISGGAGFGQLSVLQDIATGAQTGPIVSLAQGLGQALAGFANSGLLSPELFTDLANGIGQAYKQLELLGKGGLEAARLMQPSLQAIWQMIQDNPELADRLDDSTKALLEFAVANGLVGDKFRPAIDRMIDAIDALLKKLDELIDKIKGVPPVTTNTGDNTNNSGNNNNGSGNNNGGGGQGGDYTNLPMAMGGIVTRPTRALIGEAGPEAVIPLSRGSLFAPTITVIAPLQVDGYEMARAVTRYQPSVYRTYGAA